MLRSGTAGLLTAKISWSESTEFPHSTFVWRGIDGSDAVTHFITTPSTWADQTATARELVQRGVLRTAALQTGGRGDGGGGVAEDMLWNINLLAELHRIHDVARVAFASVSALFADIARAMTCPPGTTSSTSSTTGDSHDAGGGQAAEPHG
jgi:alpha-mannosidase